MRFSFTKAWKSVSTTCWLAWTRATCCAVHRKLKSPANHLLIDAENSRYDRIWSMMTSLPRSHEWLNWLSPEEQDQWRLLRPLSKLLIRLDHIGCWISATALVRSDVVIISGDLHLEKDNYGLANQVVLRGRWTEVCEFFSLGSGVQVSHQCAIANFTRSYQKLPF